MLKSYWRCTHRYYRCFMAHDADTQALDCPNGHGPMRRLTDQEVEEIRMSKPRKQTRDRPSSIEDHSYSPETGQLTVTFRGGRTYRYDGVPQEIADGLERTPSKGTFMHTSVIGKFSHTKI